MRRTIAIALATAPSIVLGAAAIAGAAETTTLGVTLSSTKAGAGSKITVSYTNRSDQPRESAPQQTHIVFSFPKGMTFPYRSFPSCKIPTSVRIPRSCKAAKVGPGTASNDARLPGLDNVHASLNVYSGGAPGILYLPAVVTSPAQVNVFIKGKLKKASGRYGSKLDVPLRLPTILGEIPFVNSFKIGPIGKTTKKKGKKISFITNPKSCPSGGWPFQLVTTYANGDTSTAKDVVRCRK